MTSEPDETEPVRRALIPQMPAELRARVHAGERVWNPKQMLIEFDVLGFQAPFVVAQRKSDGAKGSLMFTHSPRFYFGWEET
jgi:hypothetical protein